MKVGMVNTASVKCGLSTYGFYLCDALQKAGVDITILGEVPFPDNSAIDNDFKIDVPIKYVWKRTEFYTDLINESQNYDIIHIQHQFGLFNNTQAWIELLKQVKAKKVITIHDIVPPNQQFYEYFMKTFELADKIIVHTPTCLDMLKRWNCPASKIELIPHGTKLIELPDKIETRKELKLPLDAKIILSWGFIWESKGILDLVKILSELLKTYPNAILIHAGGLHPLANDPSYMKSIFRNAVKLGITPNNLKITGWVPENDVPKWFSVADVIVLNYMRGSASASGASHRTMAAYKPIVKTDDPTLEDIPGFTVPRFDVDSLYKGIVKVLSDKVLQDELIANSKKVSEETSWANVALQHKKVYENL
jgi:glycosyltransferase involved in cell wall biosynthesis